MKEREKGREKGREQHAFCLGKVRGRLTAHTIPRDNSYTKHNVTYAPWSCAVLWPWVWGVTEEKIHWDWKFAYIEKERKAFQAESRSCGKLEAHGTSMSFSRTFRLVFQVQAACWQGIWAANQDRTDWPGALFVTVFTYCCSKPKKTTLRWLRCPSFPHSSCWIGLQGLALSFSNISHFIMVFSIPTSTFYSQVEYCVTPQ